MKPDNVVKFLIEAGKLKRVKRAGWITHGIKEPESVAEHSFRTAVMAAVLADKFRVNKGKAVIMALVHDLAEAEIGDIPIRYPRLSESRLKRLVKNKHAKEKSAFSAITSLLENKDLYNVWLEYEKGESKEARFVKQLDKIEMHLQAMEYELSQKRDMSEFFSRIDKEVTEPGLKAILKEILKKR